ncbi:MAG: L,D-transpeptidase [Lachnospiraceae bacterium]|nr:L,D-transpeptidase [Lachnospiraceae bacterium]
MSTIVNKKMSKYAHMMLVFLLGILTVGICGNRAQAANIGASVSTDRAAGICRYAVSGLDLTTDTAMTVRVDRSDNKQTVWSQEIALAETNVVNGAYSGTITLQDLKYDYTSYAVFVTVGGQSVKAGVCDFSIHQSRISLGFSDNTGSAKRTVTMTNSDNTGAVLAPGTGNQVTVYAWQQGRAESTAKLIGSAQNLSNSNLRWTVDVTKAGSGYGPWNAKLVLNNSNWTQGRTIATTTYQIAPTCTSFVEKKTAALEKQKSFRLILSGLQNVVKVKSVSFQLYNQKNKKVYTTTAKLSGKKYVATVKLKKLNYNLQLYTVKALIRDADGVVQELATTADADEQAIPGSFTIKVKNNATSQMTLTGAYIPGNIKKVDYVIQKRGAKKTLGTYRAKAKKKNYSAVIPSEAAGKYTVTAYGYTNWGKKVKLASKNYKIGKKNLGKQGWYYEKYNGKKYKFYYINNEKQTDLTQILKLKKGSGKFTIELNRAAGVVTIYMYNEETKRYDIPVKSCTVSVGRDVRTNAGTGGLNQDSSYTPIGNYSICTNGEAVRYSLKTMHEPDGSIVYARWCTHIVGNVYFHAIAVSSQSHNALSYSTYNRLGTPASAGCVRMTVADAKWLYDYMPTGTPVKISVGSSSKPGPLGKPATIKSSYGVSYDPTDPEISDAQKKKDYKAGKITGYIKKDGTKVGFGDD